MSDRSQRFVGGVAESNAPVAPGEVQESRPAAPDERHQTPLGVPSFSDHLATRVLELQRDLDKTRHQLREMRQSRDLWRHRALRKAGLRAA